MSPMIEFTHRVSRRARQLKLSLKSDGTVVVTTPPLVPKFMVRKFVESHQDWISTHQAKLQAHHKKANPWQVAIFGQNYPVTIITSAHAATKVQVVNAQLQVTLRTPVTKANQTLTEATEQPFPTAAKTAIDAFLKRTAEKYLLPRTHQLAKTMRITYGRVTLREQKSRWGSCSSQGNLNFNWRLVHHPPAVIDYVIVHELAHRREMNHSRAFWSIVKQYDPAYAEHQGWLKRRGLNLS